MKILPPRIQSMLSLIVGTSIVLAGIAVPVHAQAQEPVVISFGQPNIWSLEQAHYLLARMHRQNLDLQTAALGDLDPNAANASRIDILKTLLEAGVKFDQAVQVNNALLKENKTFNSERRPELVARRSALQEESTQLSRDIAALKIAKAAAKNDEDRGVLQAQVDAKVEEKAAVDAQLSQVTSELQTLTTPSGDFQKAEVTDSFSSAKLTGDLDSLIAKVQLINPSIAATLRLDNHIQMQYEIIAKQLTLLRDEVGPGERLVFLELPQSVNATQDKAENRVAQTWWRLAGYTKVNKKELLESQVETLKRKIDEVQAQLANVEINATQADALAQKNGSSRPRLVAQLEDLCKEKAIKENEKKKRENDLKELADLKKKESPEVAAKEQALCNKLTNDIRQLDGSIKEIDKAIEVTQVAIQKIDQQKSKLQMARATLAQSFTALSTKFEKLKLEQVANRMRAERNTLDRILQGGGARTSEVVESTVNLLSQNNVTFSRVTDSESAGKSKGGRTYVSLGQTSMANPGMNFSPANSLATATRANDGSSVLRNRLVRTVDIIPRQSAVNVNDTKQRVAKTGIFAAVSFLFGFAGKFTYERQREQGQQFLNQELFTSGFGKGETDFGWIFYPFAGSKQLASGIRTTYAVAVIPDDAESVVLKARGCSFPRKQNQPANYDMAGLQTNCSPQEQVFVLPVPGSTGDGADYYVTGLWYSPNLGPGDRMVTSIYGENFPSQIGVLVNGVPLREAVGLGQLNIESILADKARENCVGDICGRFERIDAHQIVIAFKMPADFTTWPRISLIGPGKAIELNKLFLTINGEEDAQLDGSLYMFGDQPNATLRKITDFKVAPNKGDPTVTTGVLTGSKFATGDVIRVNGETATPVPGSCRSDLCVVTFPNQTTDFLLVTISPAGATEKAVSRTFVNPTTLSIISAAVVSYVSVEGTRPAVLTVKLDGSGFKDSLDVTVVKADGSPDKPKKIVPSSGQMILKVVSPESVVQITVRDPDNNKSVSTVVVTPPDEPKGKNGD